MTDIAIAYRDPKQTIAEALADTIGSQARAHLNRDQRQTATGLLLEAAGKHATVGDLLDQLDHASPDELRTIVDQARRRVDLPTLEEQQARERFEQTQRALTRDDGPTVCADPDCHAQPVNGQGIPQRLEVRRWWCPKHRDQAGPLDDLPPEQATIDPRTFRVVPSREEQDRLAAEDDRRRRDSERRRAARQAEADTLERIAERHASENPTRVMGLPVGGSDD